MKLLIRAFHFALALLLAGTFFPIATAADLSSTQTQEAKFLLDTYFGDSENLKKAAALLTSALATNKNDANIYIQAARLTVKGGHVVSGRFRPGTVEAYGELIDKALAIDPSNQKAHILKAEVFNIQKNYAQEKAELDKARELGTADAWLWIGYGRHFYSVGDDTASHHFLSKARALGPGSSAEERNAFVSALGRLAEFKPRAGEPFQLKELAQLARNARHPKDAWTLGGFAEKFVYHGMFDDAIDFSQEALRTMNYGAGRLTLASALYGKAAELKLAGKDRSANKLILEAAHFGYSRKEVLGRLSSSSPQVQRLMPTLEQIIK